MKRFFLTGAFSWDFRWSKYGGHFGGFKGLKCQKPVNVMICRENHKQLIRVYVFCFVVVDNVGPK